MPLWRTTFNNSKFHTRGEPPRRTFGTPNPKVYSAATYRMLPRHGCRASTIQLSVISQPDSSPRRVMAYRLPTGRNPLTGARIHAEQQSGESCDHHPLFYPTCVGCKHPAPEFGDPFLEKNPQLAKCPSVEEIFQWTFPGTRPQVWGGSGSETTANPGNSSADSRHCGSPGPGD